MKKIILSAESTSDLTPQLIREHEIDIHPFQITLNDRTYTDGNDIDGDLIFRTYEKTGILPKTSAINVAEYYRHFKKWTAQGFEVVHLSMTSAITSSFQNSTLAARELEGVYSVDSRNLSSGIGLLLLKAAKWREEGRPAREIAQRLESHRDKIRLTFVFDTLDYIRAGGRMSKAASISAGLLNIKPLIFVDPKTGELVVEKKYRGNMAKVHARYISDTLASYPDIDRSHIFISHSLKDESYVKEALRQLRDHTDFKEILVTRLGSTISTHSGPNTLGLAMELL